MAGPSPDQGQETWSSQLTFLMASIGFAVGLGNIWRFPYVTGENGGGAFIIIYLACAFIIGVPLVISEWSIGRRSRQSDSAAGCIADVAGQVGASKRWSMVGDLAVVAVFLMMLTYTVVASWTFDYFFKAIMGAFIDIDAAGSTSMFQDLMNNPMRLLFWHAIVVAITVYINSKGITAGIEKAVKLLIPGLFICLLAMVVYSMFIGGMGETFNFLLTPDFSKIKATTFLLAIGQAFFSIGIAMAVMITYGSYLSKDTNIPKNAFIVVSADTFVALIAGFAIFPIVFSYGLPLNSGAGLVFETLPLAFGGLPGGQIVGGIFFLLLIAAALTSCISNFAPVNAWTAEKLNQSHGKAAITSGIVMWICGLIAVFSLNYLSDVHPFGFIEQFADKTIFNMIDYVSANIMFPLGALLTSLFVGWGLPKSVMLDETGMSEDGFGYKLWLFQMRFVIPVAISIVFYMSIMEMDIG